MKKFKLDLAKRYSKGHYVSKPNEEIARFDKVSLNKNGYLTERWLALLGTFGGNFDFLMPRWCVVWRLSFSTLLPLSPFSQGPWLLALKIKSCLIPTDSWFQDPITRKMGELTDGHGVWCCLCTFLSSLSLPLLLLLTSSSHLAL